MKITTRILRQSLAVILALSMALVAHAQPKPPKKALPPPPTIEQLEKEASDLEELVAHWEKQFAGSTDAKQRASVYQQLLLRLDRLAGQINQLRELRKTASANPPKNDPHGSLTRTTTDLQGDLLDRLNQLDARLKRLRERVDKFNAPAGAGAKPGGAGKPVVTPSAGDAKRK